MLSQRNCRKAANIEVSLPDIIWKRVMEEVVEEMNTWYHLRHMGALWWK